MRYTIRIKRQENKEAKPFWQEFEIEAEGELSIAAMLNELNARQKLTDKSGKEAEPISWECGCMVKKNAGHVRCESMVCQNLPVLHFCNL